MNLAITIVLALLVGKAVGISPAGQLQQQHVTEQQDTAAKTPKYFLAEDEFPEKLTFVRDTLELLGYSEASTPADADLIWCWMWPFQRPMGHRPKLAAVYNYLPMLKEHQVVNHLRGVQHMAHKGTLVKLSSELKWLPRSFSLPGEYQAWQDFIHTPEGARMDWISKGKHHGDTSIVQDPRDPDLLNHNIIVQQLIRPFLIHNRLWDFALHVVITSLDPLLAYVNPGIMPVRICTDEYVRNITAETPEDAYVVGSWDWATPEEWVYQPRPDGKGIGSCLTVEALAGFLESKGVNSDKWWLNVQTAVVEVLRKVVPKMRDAHASMGEDTRNFFTNVRFDFMLDEHQEVYVTEVNMSPSLYLADIPTQGRLMFYRIVHDMLQLKGLAPGGYLHHATSQGLRDVVFNDDVLEAIGEPTCAADCATPQECSTKDFCLLCSRCRSEGSNLVLQQVRAESLGSTTLMRVYPPSQQLAEYMELVGADHLKEIDESADDRLVRTWFAAKCKRDFRWC